MTGETIFEVRSGMLMGEAPLYTLAEARRLLEKVVRDLFGQDATVLTITRSVSTD
ncbi:MAG TPA: hypothetical protein VGI65_00690 [Steroidobacteraceae bacterium]